MNAITPISAALPPAHDGIGDYTARLAGALAEGGGDVRVWTAADGGEPDGIEAVRIERPFTLARRRGVWGIYAAMGNPPRPARD